MYFVCLNGMLHDTIYIYFLWAGFRYIEMDSEKISEINGHGCCRRIRKMDFYKRVGITVRTVPEGKVATYGQIALLCGKPKNARQVGYALNRGLAGEVPAHRVVNSQGYLTGAASFEHPDLQRMLLEEEEVLVSAEGRVDMKRDGWKNTLEDALRLKEIFEREGI